MNKQEYEAKRDELECEKCKGTGFELCDNPDHGFLDAFSFLDIGRLGCPACGHDEMRRTKYRCDNCFGTGYSCKNEDFKSGCDFGYQLAQAEIEELKRDALKLVEALKYYADKNGEDDWPIDAIEALAEWNSKHGGGK